MVNNMERILITHTDLDGAGCAILFKRQYPDIEIRYHDYDTIDEVSEDIWDRRDEYDAIYFADITPNEEYGRKMVGDPKFILIDHHITREYLRDLSDRPNIVYDTAYCATYLTAKYLSEYVTQYEEQKAFILAVDAYDTWKLDSKYRIYGLKLNLLFNYYGMERFIEEFACMDKLTDEKYIILKVLQKMDRDYLAEKLRQGRIKTDKAGNTYFEVHVAEKGGHIGVLVDDPDFPPEARYVKTINLNDLTVGLYAKDFDVSEIAKAHGGGGHPGASGYQIEFLQNIYV